ncbi:hypothetical protein H0H81_006479, partial [Sphagnurus paluster]
MQDQAVREDQLLAPADVATNPYIPNLSTIAHVDLDTSEYMIIDLYEVRDDSKKGTVPFFSQLRIHGPQGEIVRVWGHFDDGAMIDAMSSEMYQKVGHRLAPLRTSNRKLRMANGSLVTPQGQWEGHIELGGIQVEASFEVFDSGGGWDFLFGKRLMRLFNVIHDYANDIVQIRKGERRATLNNQFHIMNKTTPPINPPAPENTLIQELGDSHDESPTREVQNQVTPDNAPADNTTKPDVILEEPTITPVCIITDIPGPEEQSTDHEAGELPTEELKNKPDIYTRKTDPFKPERVNEILSLVQIGMDLDEEQKASVQQLITEYADIFALSVSEVTTVEGAVHKLHIDKDAKFSTKVYQKPTTPPQKKYLHESIDAMLSAGIIEQCNPSEVKCVSPTTLAQKAHQGLGLSLEELQYRVNEECVLHGIEPYFSSLPPRSTEPQNNEDATPADPKWRICQNFAQINKVTQIAPMPQGDIRAKQQRLSGHRW